MEADETSSALKEISGSKDDVYKLVGQLMIKVKKEKIKEELESKEKILNASLSRLQKEEDRLSSELKDLREEIISGSRSKK